MIPAAGDAGEERPSFPISAVAIALVAMLLVGVASIAANLVVGERIRLLTRSQYAVQGAAQNIETLIARKDSALRLSLVSGDPAYLAERTTLEPQLQATFRRLEAAIRLPANRKAFAEVTLAEKQLHRIEEGIGRDIASGDLDAARREAASPAYNRLRGDLDLKLEQIQERSGHFVASSRKDIDRDLNLALVASLGAILMMGLTLYLVYRPTRSWARQLAKMERRAAAATEAKSDFLATMSHEIRTPLNGVIGFADLLLLDPSLGAGHRRQVELIQNAGGLLLTVVNDILDFSKVEAGKLELDPDAFSIITLVDNCMSIVRPAADAKALTLSVAWGDGLSPWYHGDAGRIRQVLLNLMNNAVKFTDRGGILIGVDVGAVDGDRHQLKLEVRDSGIGIPPDRVGQLFHSFVQSDASIARRYGGTGLGLSISKRLVELMGGTVEVDSVLGGGSVFAVNLSLPAVSAPDVPLDVELAPLRSSRVLLVEDLPMNQELAAEMLRRLGHEVTLAASGEEAISLAGGADFDVVLMDIQMAGIDGLTAAGLIRLIDGPRGRVPILAMTANTLPHQVSAYLAGGMNGHIAKPVRQRDLAEALRRAVTGTARAEMDDVPESLALFDEEQFESIRSMLPPDRLARHIAAFDKLARETAALGAEDPSLEAQAHKVASQAAMLGWARLSAAARTLEDGCRDGGDRAALLAAFRDCLGDLDARPRAA